MQSRAPLEQSHARTSPFLMSKAVKAERSESAEAPRERQLRQVPGLIQSFKKAHDVLPAFSELIGAELHGGGERVIQDVTGPKVHALAADGDEFNVVEFPTALVHQADGNRINSVSAFLDHLDFAFANVHFATCDFEGGKSET